MLIATAPDGRPEWKERLRDAKLQQPNVIVKVAGHPQFSSEPDFMEGGIPLQALTDIAGGSVGGGAQLCTIANTQDESLVQFYSEVLALSFFLNGDAMLPSPMTVLGARRYMNSITGQSSGQGCGNIPYENWLNTEISRHTIEVGLGGRQVQVGSSSFVAVASDCSAARAGPECGLDVLVNNQCDVQRRHVDVDIDLWLQAYDAGSYNPVVRDAFRALVRRIGTGPWGAGEWHGDGQQYFLLLWLATSLLGADGPVLDYYVYSRFCENPGNQCFLLDTGSCQACVKDPGLPWQPLREDLCGQQDIWGAMQAFQGQPAARLYDALTSVGPPPAQVFDLLAPK